MLEGEPDELVGAAVADVLGDEPFRMRTTGEIPFLTDLNGVYEQSGEDALDITVSASSGSAVVIAGDTAHEWNSFDQAWDATPLEEFDSLTSPGFTLALSLVGLLAPMGDPEPAEGAPGAAPSLMAMIPVSTGWTEIEPAETGARRFERTPASLPDGSVAYDGQTTEQLEEAAIVDAFFRNAESTVSVEIDGAGKLVRHSVVVDFDGDPDHPECAPLERLVGRTEMVVEFSDVGTEFRIRVPAPDDLVAEFPILAETPETSESELELSDRLFLDEDGERDLSGCPAP